MDELEAALEAAKDIGSPVQYDGERVAAVLKLITDMRLRLLAGSEPNVIEMPGIETFFAKVRKLAAGSRGVSLVRPDRGHFILPAPPAGFIRPEMVEGVKAVIPSEQPVNVAAMAAPGALVGDPGQKPSLPEIARRVPFMGLLVGLAYTGHAVWMFEASAETVAAGCADADVLIADSECLAVLPQDWAVDAALVMRNPNLLVFDRSRHKIGAIRTAGEVPGRIEFPN